MYRFGTQLIYRSLFRDTSAKRSKFFQIRLFVIFQNLSHGVHRYPRSNTEDETRR